MTPVLEYNHVNKWFGSTRALSDVSFQVAPGKIIGLLESNGNGKSTLARLANGSLTPDKGNLSVAGLPIGSRSKAIVSYLSDKDYLSNWTKVSQLIDCFNGFYSDFDKNKAYEMLERLDTKPDIKFRTMSKGIKEKIQLVLVMSRKASLYLLDEPVGGVDPATRDYILNTILTNYNEEGSIIISTRLIYDTEQVLDDVIFLESGRAEIIPPVDEIRTQYWGSTDELFREVFRC